MFGKMKFGEDSIWSWVLTVSSFIIFFVIFGTGRIQGVLFKSLLESDGGMTREEASWPFTLGGAAIIFAAPITGFLSTIFSSRIIAFVGTIIFAVGSVSCFFSTNIYFISANYGVLRGIGGTLCTITLPGIINKNFVRYRATAMGIVTSGTPIGGFIFPLLAQVCLETYGLKGTFLLIGGMSLQAAIGCMALVEYKQKDSGTRGNVNQKHLVEVYTLNMDNYAGTFQDVKVPGDKKSYKETSANPQEPSRNNFTIVKFDKFSRYLDEGKVKGVDSKSSDNDYKTQGGQSSKKGILKVINKQIEDLKESSESSIRYGSHGIRRRSIISESENDSDCSKSKEHDSHDLKSLKKKPMKLHGRNGQGGYSNQAFQPESTSTNEEVLQKPLELIEPEGSYCQPIVPYDDSREIKTSALHILKNVMTSRGFYLITLTNMAIAFCLSTFTLLIVDYGNDKGIELQMSIQLLTACSVGEIIGRLGLGWVTDRKYVSRPTFLVWSLLATAVTVTLLALLNDPIVLMICVAIFGAGQGSALNVSTVMYAEYLKKEDIVMAISITRSFVGMTFLPRSPLIGIFRDELGSYDYLFLMMAALFYISAISWLVEGIALKKTKMFTLP